ncbi:HAD-IIIA family hydrolase [Amylibacter sp.]|nr:HAD-IIIA family hydrolase [Amylibacter sp.]
MIDKKKYGVVINAGGLGSRLANRYDGLPKALVPVFDKPILVDQIDKFISQGFNVFYIFLGHRADLIIEELKRRYTKKDVELNTFVECEPLGSGGAILANFSELPEHFIFTYCDIYFDLSIEKMISFHEANTSSMTILVHPNDHPYDSDLVSVNPNNLVNSIKPHPHTFADFTGNLVNAAFYIVNKTCLSDFRNKGGNQDFAQDIIPSILSKFVVSAYKTPEFLKDMGTPERLDKVRQNYSNRFRLAERNQVICLDRDGTLNKCVKGDYITHPEEFELLDGVSEAVSIIRKLGFFVVCVTNQPVIARGDVDEVGLKKIHMKMDWLLGAENAYLDGIYYCPHHTDSGYPGEIVELKIDCDCRKPKIGLLEQVMDYIPFKCSDSWFVGDSWRDIQCGQTFGMRTCSVGTEDLGADVKVETLLQFAKLLQQNKEFL